MSIMKYVIKIKLKCIYTYTYSQQTSIKCHHQSQVKCIGWEGPSRGASGKQHCRRATKLLKN